MFNNIKTSSKLKKSTIKNFFLTIPKDLKNIPTFAKVTIIFLCLLMLWNTFFDFNHFIDPKNNPSVWTIVNNKNFKLWQQFLLILNGIAAFANIVCIILVVFGKISNYFWGFIAVSTYGLFAMAWDYVGDMQLNLFFFLPFQIIGYNLWKFHLDSHQEVISKRLNLKSGIVTIYFAIILLVFFYFEIPEFSRVILGSYSFEGNDFNKVFPHALDSLNNSLSIVAQILMLLRLREQWFFWIIVNVSQIIMFSGIAHNRLDVNMLIMWTVALGNSFLGLYQWFFIRSEEKTSLAKTKKDKT